MPFSFFSVFFLFYCFLCYFEIITFNEEILLAQCFLSFVFFCFVLFANNTFTTFNQRALGFESDYFSTFLNKKVFIINHFNGWFNFSKTALFIITNLQILLFTLAWLGFWVKNRKSQVLPSFFYFSSFYQLLGTLNLNNFLYFPLFRRCLINSFQILYKC